MVDLSPFILGVTLNVIEGSYSAGRDALISRIELADEEAAIHAANLDAGQVEDEHRDEATGDSYSQTEYLFFQSEMSREMLNSHAQAFAIMIHHAWEKHVLSLNAEWKAYECHKAYGELLKTGWMIDKPRLERLRMVSNFIKHESQEILDHHREMFAEKPGHPIEDRLIFEDDALIVSDDDIHDFLDAVYQSAHRVRR